MLDRAYLLTSRLRRLREMNLSSWLDKSEYADII